MQWFIKALRQYADFSGRARRMEYWMYTLFQILIAIGLVVVFGSLAAATGLDALWIVMGVTLGIYFLALVVPTLAVTARRLHDIGQSGWWQLVGFLPLGGFVLLIMCVIDGNWGPNRYGLDPKGRVGANPGYYPPPPQGYPPPPQGHPPPPQGHPPPAQGHPPPPQGHPPSGS